MSEARERLRHDVRDADAIGTAYATVNADDVLALLAELEAVERERDENALYKAQAETLHLKVSQALADLSAARTQSERRGALLREALTFIEAEAEQRGGSSFAYDDEYLKEPRDLAAAIRAELQSDSDDATTRAANPLPGKGVAAAPAPKDTGQ